MITVEKMKYIILASDSKNYRKSGLSKNYFNNIS